VDEDRSLTGIPWHVIQRGNKRAACFYCTDDYHRSLQDIAASRQTG
jgi:REP element-mobilizing transposase RayT